MFISIFFTFTLLFKSRLPLVVSSVSFMIWESAKLSNLVQTGFDKCEFAQKNCLSLPKSVENMLKRRQSFAQSLHKFVQL